jgi:predicted RNase H-like HicB family nuclease
MTPADRYHYSVHWSEKDGCFVGAVLELSSLSYPGEDPVEALRGIWSLAHEVVEDFERRGEWVPEPFTVEAELQAHLREAAYRMVAKGTCKLADRSTFRTLDQARAMLQERRS